MCNGVWGICAKFACRARKRKRHRALRPGAATKKEHVPQHVWHGCYAKRNITTKASETTHMSGLTSRARPVATIVTQ